MARRRIDWTSKERAVLHTKMVETFRVAPQASGTYALRQAQKQLPPERRRRLQILTYRDRQHTDRAREEALKPPPEMPPLAHEPPRPEPAPPPPTEGDNLLSSALALIAKEIAREVEPALQDLGKKIDDLTFAVRSLPGNQVHLPAQTTRPSEPQRGRKVTVIGLPTGLQDAVTRQVGAAAKVNYLSSETALRGALPTEDKVYCVLNFVPHKLTDRLKAEVDQSRLIMFRGGATELIERIVHDGA